MIQLELFGKPVPWTAPVFGKRGTHSKHTEKKTAMQWQIKSQFNQSPLKGPVRLILKFFFLPPKNTSYVRKKQMLAGIMHHVKRPDTSNLTKLCEDSLTGIVFEDDSQVVEIQAKKLYGEKEKTLIMIESLNQE